MFLEDRKYTAMHLNVEGITLTKVHFTVPKSWSSDTVVIVGAGILFHGDCTSDEPWCIVRDDNHEVVHPSHGRHHMYGWRDEFADTEETSEYEVSEYSFG
jgi:hypothetical protein